MTNRDHLVAIPDRLDSIRLSFIGLMERIPNASIARTSLSPPWQERPFSCLLDESHLMNAIRYVEQNPVRAKVVAHPADYRWSGAAAHCSGYEDPWLDIESPPLTMPETLLRWPEDPILS